MRIKLLVLLLIFFCSCDRKTTDDGRFSVIRIDLLSEPKATINKLSDFAEDIRYIPLRTTRESLISQVQKVVNRGERLYIFDNFLKQILCFDIDGNFLFKLDKRGRGPGEYTTIADFDVSPDNEFLAVLNLSQNILFYRISENGFTFERAISSGMNYPWKIGIVPETDYIFLSLAPWTGTEPTVSFMINTEGDTINYKPNCYKYSSDRGMGRSQSVMWVYNVDNKVCFREFFSDTVFHVDVTDNSFKPRIIFGTHNMLTTPPSNEIARKDRVITIESLSETSRYVFCFYRVYSAGSPEDYGLLFDKKTKTKYKLDVEVSPELNMAGGSIDHEKTKIKEDLNGGPDLSQRIELWDKFCSGGKLFSFVDAMAFKSHIESEEFKNVRVKYPEKKGELELLANSLEETANPVLVLVTLKE
jgi:hypothetical protein